MVASEEMLDFRLEKPIKSRKKEALEFAQEFLAANEKISGSGGLDYYGDDYDAYLKNLGESEKREATDEKAPSYSFFLIRISDDKIVGIISIRPILNYSLWHLAGNIGYSTRPSERRKGYAKTSLKLALDICRTRFNMKLALLACDKNNIASAKTIQALNGNLICEYKDDEYEQGAIIQKCIIVL
ncbi:MAG: GNAT family N-acetyltransferase [Candidatus Saccharibacteria bacterium]|nr:GNAT family N-acetyltransferase [Candidatus Saccharibacteria bacterium]